MKQSTHYQTLVVFAGLKPVELHLSEENITDDQRLL